MSAVASTLKIIQLEGELRTRQIQASLYINLLDQIVIALEEEDYDEALSLAKGRDQG